ncbi:centrosomal protein of 55 kDa-like [Xenentodon cancila]
MSARRDFFILQPQGLRVASSWHQKMKKCFSSAEQHTKERNLPDDALEKNRQWLEWDQQREASVRVIMARMLWLVEQLNKAYQACSDHEDYSDDEPEVLREQFEVTHQKLIISQNWCLIP